MAIRLINAGAVSPLRSQTLYHGLAHARTEATPDTVVLTTPASPYVCIGYHQSLEREIDLEHCAARGLPVFRREVGGGAVYLDSDQLFVQWVMGEQRLPRRLAARFALYAEPIVATYAEYGIDAHYHRPNDIHVGARKICGTGAGHIGNAEVLVGNFIFDFDTDAMAGILAVGSRMLRDEIRRSLREYMTSMRRELDTAPPPADVVTRYCRQLAAALDDEVVAGALTGAEQQAVDAVERRFLSDEFRRGSGGLERHGVKIHEDVWVREVTGETAAGTAFVVARLRRGRLEGIAVRGGGSVAPPPELMALEVALAGVELRRPAVEAAVRTCFNGSADDACVDGWVHTIMSLQGNQVRVP